MNNVFLCEAVATRLSHDLIGNIGAVANAVELLNDCNSDDLDDIRPILDFSADVLSKRLKFFRICFGLSNATVKSADELNKLLIDYCSTLGNPSFPTLVELKIETPKVYKLIMPAVMIMADTLVKGGKISVMQNANGIHILAESTSALNQTKLNNIDLVLANKPIDENPSIYAPLYYLMAYLGDNDVPIKRIENALIIGE